MVPAADIDAAMEDNGLTDILYNIISEQNYQIHQFRNYLGAAGLLPGESAGSCYNPQTHGVTCNVPESSCTGYYYAPGYVSSMSQCCHCKASCAVLSSSCSYYDDNLEGSTTTTFLDMDTTAVAGGTTAAAGGTTAAAGGTTETVSGSFTISGVSFADVTADTQVEADFKSACASAIAARAGSGVEASMVSVTLAEGSVAVSF